MRARDYIPALRFGARIYPDDLATPLTFGRYWYVDGDNGVDNDNSGQSIEKAKLTIQAAVTATDAGDVIFVKTLAMSTGALDPVSYDETIIIPPDKDRLSLIGVGTGRTQGGLPQIKIGAGSTAMLTVRAPGCYISNLGFNGASSTGGGILLDDDGSTKTAFGTTIEGCHIKNCAGATSADTGGGIMWAATGGAWQSRIQNCSFFRCMGGVVLMGTTGSRPADVVIEDSIFYTNDTALVDCDVYLMGGSGVDGLLINRCVFASRTVPAYAGTSRYLKLTGCSDGLISNSVVNCLGNVTATELTWGTAGTGGFIPTGVGIANCYGVSTTAGETGEINNL